MFKKYLFITLLTLGLGFLFSSKAYAAVDIKLEDNPSDKTIDININSNSELLSGVVMEIFFSNDIVVREINETNDFCSMGFNSVASNGIISIECLNDERSVFNDTLATITYTTDEPEYFFYVEESTIDIGDPDIGTISNINKPENIGVETSQSSGPIVQPKEDNIVMKIVDFIQEYYIYISVAVITIVIGLLISLFKK
jgi:hypothetical protein